MAAIAVNAPFVDAEISWAVGSFQVTGSQEDGGYAQYMLAEKPWQPFRMPHADGRRPTLCAGVTTFNSFRHSGAQAGDLVAVLRSSGRTRPFRHPVCQQDGISRGGDRSR